MEGRTLETAGSTPLFKKRDLVRLILPLIIELILSLLVGMADSVMVSRVSEDAVSGVSLVDTVMQLLIFIFAALGTGGNVVSSQYLGRQKLKDASESIRELILFALVLSLGITALLLGGRSLLLDRFFGQITQEVRACASIYLIITAFSIPAIALYEASAAAFRTMGKTKVTMWISLLMNLINISGNAIFIYGFQMGAAGAALGTLISRWCAGLLILFLLTDTRLPLHIPRDFRFRPNWARVKKILHVAVPTGMENGIFQLGKILVLNLVSTFGTAAIAANAIASSISTFQDIPGKAIALGLTTVVARCMGIGDPEQARYYNRLLTKWLYGIILVGDTAIYLLLPLVLPIYALGPEAEGLAMSMVLCHTLGAMAYWPPTFGLPASLRAAGDAKFVMLTSIVSMWVFRVGGAYVLAQGLNLGVMGVWYAMIADWLFRGTVFIFRWAGGKWKTMEVI